MWREPPIDYFKHFQINIWFYIVSHCAATLAMVNKYIKSERAYMIKEMQIDP